LIYIGQNAMERLSKLLSYNNLKENHWLTKVTWTSLLTFIVFFKLLISVCHNNDKDRVYWLERVPLLCLSNPKSSVRFYTFAFNFSANENSKNWELRTPLCKVCVPSRMGCSVSFCFIDFQFSFHEERTIL
jgi:hypothetical protein